MAKKDKNKMIGAAMAGAAMTGAAITGVPMAGAAMTGAMVLNTLLKKYGDTPISQIKDLASVETVSPRWEDRPKSNIVKWLMDKSGRTLDEIAKGLGCTTTYLNNKLHRDSFSLDDMIIIAYICGYRVSFTSSNPDDKKHSTYQIDVLDYFGTSNTDAVERLLEFEKQQKIQKKDEYEELKARLAHLKEEYGFED